MVCLDELMPADDRYRRLDGLVDWSFVRAAAAPTTPTRSAAPRDPIVLVKLMLAGALEGIGSVRELVRAASMRLDLRRFPPDALARPDAPLRRPAAVRAPVHALGGALREHD